MRTPTVAPDHATASSRLSLGIATSREDLLEVQRLRYRIFIEMAGLQGLENADDIDADRFDDYCDHLIVRDCGNNQIVGTYRMLNPHRAREAGRLYAEGEFDLTPLRDLRSVMVEAGRACIHPEYRSGAVIMLLWAGLAAYMQREGCQYLAGCASISLDDGGVNASAVYHAITHQLAPPPYRVKPHTPFPLHPAEGLPHAQVPPLLKGYLRSGAWVCGEPAWDAEFNCADLFMMLPLARLDGRYARHYLKERML